VRASAVTIAHPIIFHLNSLALQRSPFLAFTEAGGAVSEVGRDLQKLSLSKTNEKWLWRPVAGCWFEASITCVDLV
jgi:hypothetical protein